MPPLGTDRQTGRGLCARWKKWKAKNPQCSEKASHVCEGQLPTRRNPTFGCAPMRVDVCARSHSSPPRVGIGRPPSQPVNRTRSHWDPDRRIPGARSRASWSCSSTAPCRSLLPSAPIFPSRPHLPAQKVCVAGNRRPPFLGGGGGRGAMVEVQPEVGGQPTAPLPLYWRLNHPCISRQPMNKTEVLNLGGVDLR